ncbi:MAG: GTP-binding protein [Candidatus Heimdallarchaeota archaeon]
MASVTLRKITLLGDAAVGKTSLRNRFMGKSFSSRYLMTMGADISSKVVEIDGTSVKYQIWDLAGQARFSAVRSMYYQGAIGGVLVFDVTRKETYNEASAWVQELWNNSGKGIVPLILLGNKIDLRGSSPEGITSQDGQALSIALTQACSEQGIEIPYLETSAKTGENVEQAFELLGKSIMKFTGC